LSAVYSTRAVEKSEEKVQKGKSTGKSEVKRQNTEVTLGALVSVLFSDLCISTYADVLIMRMF
jgi:hypothetical protein